MPNQVMTTHTPGPWRFNEQWREIHADEGGAVVRICNLLENDRDYNDNTLDANARLIAAAPGLLEACRVALDHIGTDPNVADDPRANSVVRLIITTAIAMATGQEENA